MKKILKAIPFMALLLGVGLFSVNAALKTESTLVDQEWLKDASDPTNPDSYIQVPAGTQNDCEGENEVCVVLAPADANGRPDFTAVSGLEQALENSTDHPNIIKAPYNP